MSQCDYPCPSCGVYCVFADQFQKGEDWCCNCEWRGVGPKPGGHRPWEASKYVLIQDGDGDWYVCPEDKQEQAAKYFKQWAEFYEYGQWDDISPAKPDYLVEVGGAPSLVAFMGYVIRK